MPRWIKPTAPEKGRKINFDDDAEEGSEGFVEDTFSDLEDDDAEMSTRVQSRAGPAPPSEDEESDDDDAPEVVGIAQGRQSEASKAAKIQEAEEARKEVARARAKKIQALKDAEKKVKAELKAKNKPNAAGTRKGKGKEVEPQPDFESPFGEEDENDYEDDDEEGSFHSEDEDLDEDLDEDDEELDESDSEKLEDGPVDAETLRLRQRMQRAMEAAERNAMGSPSASPPPKGKKSALKKTKAPVVVEEARPAGDEIFDLQPGAPKPLSMDILQRAAEAEAAAGEATGKRKRRKENKVVRKRVKGEQELARERAVGGRTTVHLLAPTHPQGFNAMPPVFDPRAPKIGAPSKAMAQFEKKAMKQSGAAQRQGTRKKAALVMNR